MSEIRSVIRGTGFYLPENIVTNHHLAEFVDTSDEWIMQRTGIRQRHFAADDEFTSHMATKACVQALNNANIVTDDVDAIVLGTCTPDHVFPSTAVHVQKQLGITRGFAYDVAAVCAGFVFALHNADMLIRTGQAETILVVGADRMQSLLDFNDRSTCVLFGDGAGAVVLQKANSDDGDRGIIGSELHTDPQHYDSLIYNTGVGSNSICTGSLVMDGRDVFRHAVSKMSAAVFNCLKTYGYSIDDVDCLVPHQANKRIINAVGEKLGIAQNKVAVSVGEYANISAATVPVALAKAIESGQVRQGDMLAFTALGGGFAWGANILTL